MKGPTLTTIPERKYNSCYGCEYLDRYMVKSGNNPIYANDCTHPEASKQWKLHGNIGSHDSTPMWCPCLQNQRPKPINEDMKTESNSHQTFKSVAQGSCICNSFTVINGIKTCFMKNGTHPSCPAASNSEVVCGMNIEPAAPSVNVLQIGWTCPRCGKVHSPLSTVCDCPVLTMGSASNGVPLQSQAKEETYPAEFVFWLCFKQEQFQKTYGRMDEDKFYDTFTGDSAEDEDIVYYTLPDLYKYFLDNVKGK